MPSGIDNHRRGEGQGFELNADLMGSFTSQVAVWPCTTLPP